MHFHEINFLPVSSYILHLALYSNSSFKSVIVFCMFLNKPLRKMHCHWFHWSIINHDNVLLCILSAVWSGVTFFQRTTCKAPDVCPCTAICHVFKITSKTVLDKQIISKSICFRIDLLHKHNLISVDSIRKSTSCFKNSFWKCTKYSKDCHLNYDHSGF